MSKAELYKQILINDHKNKELTLEDFTNTLEYFQQLVRIETEDRLLDNITEYFEC